jgi:hypothetical protein
MHASTLAAFRVMVIAARDKPDIGHAHSVTESEEEAIQYHAKVLHDRLPCLVSFPADAQVALLRWAWVNGAGNKKFSLMFSALKPNGKRFTPDFDRAAETHIWQSESLDAKLIITHLFQNATDVLHWNLDITSLVWPRTVPAMLGAKAKFSGEGAARTSVLRRLGGYGVTAGLAVGAIMLARQKKMEAALTSGSASRELAPPTRFVIPEGVQVVEGEFVDEPDEIEPRGAPAAVIGRPTRPLRMNLNRQIRKLERHERKLDVKMNSSRIIPESFEQDYEPSASFAGEEEVSEETGEEEADE